MPGVGVVIPFAFMPALPAMPGRAPVLGTPCRIIVLPGPPGIGGEGEEGGVAIAGLPAGFAMPGRTGFRSGSMISLSIQRLSGL